MKFWTKEEENLIIDLYNKGESNLSISNHFEDRNYSTVNSKIKKMREKNVIGPRGAYNDTPESTPKRTYQKVIIPLTEQELRYDLRNYSNAMKAKLRASGKLMGQKVIHIGLSFVVIQGTRYKESYTYHELKQMGIKCN